MWKLKTNLGHSLEGGRQGKRSRLTPSFSPLEITEMTAPQIVDHNKTFDITKTNISVKNKNQDGKKMVMIKSYDVPQVILIRGDENMMAHIH